MAKYSWPDGSKNHTISWAEHLKNTGTTRTTGPAGTTYVDQPALAQLLGNTRTSGAEGTTYINQPALAALLAGTGGAPTAGSPGTNVAPTNPAYEARYNADVNSNDTSYNNDIAGYKYGEDQAGSEYGFQIQRDEKGNVNTDASLANVDPNNPFSKMSLLTRSYQQEQAGNMNGYAAQGQLNSGAYHRQAENAQFNNSKDNDSLRKAFADVVNQSTLGRNASASNRTAGNTSAAANRLTNYLGQG